MTVSSHQHHPDYAYATIQLLEWVCTGSPPSKEKRKTNCLKDTSQSSNSYGVQWALLSGDLSNERRSRAGHEDQRPQVRRALVAERARSINQRTNTIRLHSAANQGSTPCSGCRGGLLGLDELLFRVRGLSAVVGVAEDGAKYSKGSSVVEDGAEGDSRRLNRWEVVERHDCDGRKADVV